MNCEQCGGEMVQIGEPYETVEPFMGQLAKVLNTDYACLRGLDIDLSVVTQPEYRWLDYRCASRCSWEPYS